MVIRISMYKASIVIPTYNEKYNIKPMVEALCKIKNLYIVVVDDNSPDGTGQIAESLKNRYKQVHVVHRVGKRGLGFSIIDGLKYAKTPIIGVIDCDFSHPTELIPMMLKQFDTHADFVIGSRYVKSGGIENWPISRRITSKGAVIFAKLVTNVKDPVSGFFFIRKEIFDRINIGSRNAKSWKVVLDLIVKSGNINILEVPYIFKDRKEGSSKLDFKEYLHYILQVFELLKYKILG